MNKKTIYLLIFITVILIGGVGAGIYFKESSFINSLTPSFLPGVILPAGEGNLTFQWTGGYDGAFRLEDSEYDFWVDIKPYVILDDYYAIFDYKKVVGIQQIHDELPNVNFAQYIINKDYDNISINKWGINFTNIPQDYADKIEKIAFVLDDSNNITWDDVTLNKKSKIVKLFDDIEIDYSDLLDEGFTVELHNKTTLLIGNVTGKTMLFLDQPLAYNS